MVYFPLTEFKRNEWIDWLIEQQNILNGKDENSDNFIFETPDGDVATAKDIVGNFLAYLTNQTVEIN